MQRSAATVSASIVLTISSVLVDLSTPFLLNVDNLDAFSSSNTLKEVVFLFFDELEPLMRRFFEVVCDD